MQVRAAPDMAVVTEAKKLCAYVMSATDSSPKKFRFTFTSRLQNTALDIVEALFRANDIWIGEGMLEGNPAERRSLQQKASADCKLLGYLAYLAQENRCILPKQFEQISRHTTECMRLLTAWVKSDTRRISAL